MKLCIFTFTLISSLPCLHTFWYAISTSPYIFNVLYIYARNTNKHLPRRVAKPSKTGVNPCLLSSNEFRPHLPIYRKRWLLMCEWSWILTRAAESEERKEQTTLDLRQKYYLQITWKSADYCLHMHLCTVLTNYKISRELVDSSFVPMPLPDFISLPWRKIGRRPGSTGTNIRHGLEMVDSVSA